MLRLPLRVYYKLIWKNIVQIFFLSPTTCLKRQNQVHFMYLHLDLCEFDQFKIVRDGYLVEEEDEPEEKDMSLSKKDDPTILR